MITKTTHFLRGLFSSGDHKAVNNIDSKEVTFDPGLKPPQLVTNVEVLPQVATSMPANVKGGLRGDNLPEFAQQFRCGGVGSGEDALFSVTNHESLELLPYTKKYKAGEYYYGGSLFKGFGHFIAESIHRLAPFESLKNRKSMKGVIFQPQRSRLKKQDSTPLLPEHLYEILRYLGVEKKQVILQKKPYRVESLWVSPQESYFRSRDCISETYRDFLSRCESRAGIAADTKLPDRLYISRTSFLLRGSFAGEKYIEGLLSRDGYTIFQPEKYDLFTQLKYYKSAKEIIFSEGAALHVLELLGEIPGRVTVIQRRQSSNKMFGPLLDARCSEVSFFSHTHSLQSLFVAQGQTTAAAGSALAVLDQAKFAAYINDKLTQEVFDNDAFARQVAIDILKYYQTYEQAIMQSKASNNLLKGYKSSVARLNKSGLVNDINFES